MYIIYKRTSTNRENPFGEPMAYIGITKVEPGQTERAAAQERAYQENGEDSLVGVAFRAGATFKRRILETHSSFAEAKEREAELIEEYGTLHPNGYNAIL